MGERQLNLHQTRIPLAPSLFPCWPRISIHHSQSASRTKKILEREKKKKKGWGGAICHNWTRVLIQKRKRKCDNHLSLVAAELRIRNREATRGQSFKFLIHGQLKMSHTADPKKKKTICSAASTSTPAAASCSSQRSPKQSRRSSNAVWPKVYPLTAGRESNS